MNITNAIPNNIKIYLAVKMTGRYADEVLEETLTAKQLLEGCGFTVLSPVIEENIPDKHEILQPDMNHLLKYWQRDKQMLQEAHIMVDYNSQGASDGVNVEMGYTRFFMWKPLLRLHPTLGYTISRIEYDCVVNNVEALMFTLVSRFNSRQKLFWWRVKMLLRCLPKFVYLQVKFLGGLI